MQKLLTPIYLCVIQGDNTPMLLSRACELISGLGCSYSLFIYITVKIVSVETDSF